MTGLSKNKIVVPIDFSGESFAAIDTALEIASTPRDSRRGPLVDQRNHFSIVRFASAFDCQTNTHPTLLHGVKVHYP